VEGDRDAPGALTADHPVRTPFDHGPNAVFRLLGDPARILDRLKRGLAETKPRSLQGRGRGPPGGAGWEGEGLFFRGRALTLVRSANLSLSPGGRGMLVHRDEPLRGGAEDDLGLGPPAVRIAVLEVGGGGEQSPGLAQVRADRAVRRVELRVDDAALAAEPRPILAILPVAGDREDGIDAVRLAEQEIVLAMVRRHVDEPGARIGGDEIAGEERPRLGEEAAEMVHRVAGDGAGEVGAFEGGDHAAPWLRLCERRYWIEYLSFPEFILKVGCDDNVTLFRPYQNIFDLRPIGDRLVDGDRPRRGRPDYRMCADQLRDRAFDDLESHVDLGGRDVLIFHLGLGEGGLFDRRPHHRLGAAV